MATAIATVVLIFNTVQNHRTRRIADEIKVQTNGLNAELLKVTSKMEYAKGFKKGKGKV